MIMTPPLSSLLILTIYPAVSRLSQIIAINFYFPAIFKQGINFSELHFIKSINFPL